MRINSPNRRASIVSAIAVLFLAFTVLGWGTAYKLSLYHRDGNSSPTIPVKLLSQKERPSTTQVVESLLPVPPNHQPSGYYPAIIIVGLMFGLRLIVSDSMLEVDLDDSRKQRSAHTSFFSFRPPPALLPSN
jgi:hypothetical protein